MFSSNGPVKQVEYILRQANGCDAAEPAKISDTAGQIDRVYQEYIEHLRATNPHIILGHEATEQRVA